MPFLARLLALNLTVAVWARRGGLSQWLVATFNESVGNKVSGLTGLLQSLGHFSPRPDLNLDSDLAMELVWDLVIKLVMECRTPSWSLGFGGNPLALLWPLKATYTRRLATGPFTFHANQKNQKQKQTRGPNWKKFVCLDMSRFWIWVAFFYF